jgi:hypothetical protein
MTNERVLMDNIEGVLNSLCGTAGCVALIWFFFQSRLEKYLDSYLSKKGEMLARKEDIELLRAEVKVLTRDAETIKAEIGHDLWGKQRRWERQWDICKEVLDLVDQRIVQEAYMLVATNDQESKVRGELCALNLRYMVKLSLAQVVLPQSTVDVLEPVVNFAWWRGKLV